ncbi:zinc finger matrin-type protein 1-like [Haematobia irritans]|uniref:zinc finger matrin-type protein 1-like n=1 Tax=Haematobia irritans TaxID=7368 RepID=UPI003F505003
MESSSTPHKISSLSLNETSPISTQNNMIVPGNDGEPHTYGEYKAGLKRKFVMDIHQSFDKNWDKTPECDEKGEVVLFMGRDETYPDALNALLHHMSCNLCNVKFNSPGSARDHYESKAHDKALTGWIRRNYTDKGLDAPQIRRYHRQGPAGPDAFHCDLCDLKLTSLTHAEQHYSGRRHLMVLSKRGKPSGDGYYNNEGKWVRLSTKAFPKTPDRRFGIGEQFQTVESDTVSTTSDEVGNANLQVTISPKAPKIVKQDITAKPAKIPKVDENDRNFCAICRVSVTSALQMTMHLSGVKHQKKLKASGVEITNTGHLPFSSIVDATTNDTATLSDNVLNSVVNDNKPDPTDLSMYRTPSGQYYCKTCNITITNLNALDQHLKGKRHLKSALEQKASIALAGRNNKFTLPNK